MWNHNNYSRKFRDNFKCKCDQGKSILDGIVSGSQNNVYRYLHKSKWALGFVM